MFHPAHAGYGTGHAGGSAVTQHQPQQQPQQRKEPRFTVLYAHTDEDTHCAAVESIVATSSGQLFTASRDSTIRRWDFGTGRPACSARFEGHVDWVNGLALVGEGLLASCSSDRTVKLWKADSDGECLHTFADCHSDYVTRVATAPAAGLVASAGLRSEVFLYDLGAMKAVPLQPASSSSSSPPSAPGSQDSGAGAAEAGGARENGGVGAPTAAAAGGGGGGGGGGGALGSGRMGSGPLPPPPPQQQQQGGQQHSAASHHHHHGPKGSIYALTMTPSGSLLATGTTESFIRVYDPRSHTKAMKLKGHTDNVRALQLNDAGTLLLSASSDDTVRLWDMRQQRCIQTLALHTDSVWCLAATADFSTVFSGGRDRRLFRTHLGRRETQLFAQADGPVRAMALTPDEGQLWASANSPAVVAYDAPPWSSEQQDSGPRSASLSRSFLGGSPALRLRQGSDLSSMAREQRSLQLPVVTIPGAPALVAYRILPDKRHVLTQDSRCCVARWDVLSGCIVESYGKVDLLDQERALWRPVSVPSWFSADVRTGRLAVHLDPPGCFSAETYALDLGITGAQDDVKLNLGACLLRNALRLWALRYSAAVMSGAPIPGLDDAAWPEMPRFSEAEPPAVISQDARGAAWRRPFTAFTGAEPPEEYVPAWAASAVLHATFPYVRELKAAFVLQPAEGCGLPSLLQSRLNAPRILQVKKVVNYCASKLAELGVPLSTLDVTWDPASRLPPTGQQQQQGEQQQQQQPEPHRPQQEQQQQGQGEQQQHQEQQQQQKQQQQQNQSQGQQPKQQQQQYLELTCNGMAIPCELSVAAVKKLVWRRSDDVVFLYRVLDPSAPAPLPKLEPE